MAKFTLDSSLLTGIAEIDGQHRELVKRIEELDVAIYNNTARVQMVMMIEYLESYVGRHFDAEEEILMKIGYPDFSAHYEEHKKFREWFSQVLREYKEKGADNYLAMDINREIGKWFDNHLMVTDAAYIPYLKKAAGS
ncbi:MAG TPA: hemerythrin family protein [Spirochaetota bacterium]|nr:hemerythrin family protein [Spirochaetota bacterium]HOD14269.1 hemerythrin family protein [Spirochaetota bacterium]HPG50598.1 hemerythrin family protein [Spirochaetota bacterium]HPN12199.1 hemerythrin family protein [Spirochaetota bacterium]HQL83229.1 hemerythrin family protein [Spirochaetota bacterium]